MSMLVEKDDIPAIIRQLRHAAATIAAETVLEIVERYRETAAIDTGFMRSSAYTVTHEVSTYGQHLTGDGPMLPEVAKPGDARTAYAAVAASYSCYPEYGTVHMGAQPAFVPAVDHARVTFRHKLAALHERVKG